jgi:hypothetical protein
VNASSAMRVAAEIVATAVLAVLPAACGSSNKVASVTSPTAGGSVKGAQLKTEYLRFASCMRSHGVRDFPDPITGSGGHPGFSLQGGSSSDLSSSSRTFQAGVEACQRILGHQFRFVFTPSGVGKGS